VNQGKDHTKKTAQAIMTAKAGAFMGINSMRSPAYFRQAGNDISRSRVTASFYAFENFTRYALLFSNYFWHIYFPLSAYPSFYSFRAEPKVKWKSRQGILPDEISYFPRMSYGTNSYETLIFSGVVIFTDAYLPIRKLTGKQYFTRINRLSS
jgi:hypothetical protein